MTVLGTMRTSGGLVFELTTDDALWLGRAIMGESIRDRVHVGSCMLRRLAWVSDQRNRAAWPSLAVLLHGDRDGDGSADPGEAGYSQPVAVQWRERGDAARQARRARMRSLTWSEVDASVRATVLELLTGQRALSAPGAVHFADGPTSRAFLERTPGARVVLAPPNAEGTFIAMPTSVSYRDPVIRAADGSAGVPPASGGGSLALFLAVLAVELFT